VPDEKKPERVQCPDCKQFYDAGQPHSQFCPGVPPNSLCTECDEPHEEAFKCRRCGETACPECGDRCERLCGACGACVDEEDED